MDQHWINNLSSKIARFSQRAIRFSEHSTFRIWRTPNNNRLGGHRNGTHTLISLINWNSRLICDRCRNKPLPKGDSPMGDVPKSVSAHRPIVWWCWTRGPLVGNIVILARFFDRSGRNDRSCIFRGFSFYEFIFDFFFIRVWRRVLGVWSARFVFGFRAGRLCRQIFVQKNKLIIDVFF